MKKLLLIAILAIHGLIHTFGFVKAFGLADINELTQSISTPEGILWLLAVLLFLGCAIALVLNNDWWWVTALAAVLLSQTLILTRWQDAKVGTFPNLLIMGAVGLSFGSILFERGYRKEVQQQLKRLSAVPEELLTEADIQSLPHLVQAYLRYVGVVGKPKVISMHAILAGEMRDRGRGFFPLTAEQYNFYTEPTRLFFMKARMFGMTIPGYHRYVLGRASMDVRLLGLFSVAKHMGDEMDTADTVTLFNDMCLLAPATLIDERIAWESIDDTTVNATFTNHGITIHALLYFNAEGQLINFTSQDRWAVADMKQYPFSTPVSRYENIRGFNLPTYGEMIWHFPEGDFTYGKLDVKDVTYNIRALQNDW